MAATLCLIIGTFFPIIYQLIKGLSISISNQYFYYVFVPLALVIVLLAVIVPHLKPRLKFILNIKNTSMVLSHTGILILALGIALNATLKQDIEFIGKIGASVKQDNFSVALKNIKYAEGPNYYRQIGEFWIEQNNEIVILKPENRLYRIENAISAESDIYSFVAKDIYVVLGSLEDDGTLHANIYIRPWMSLIWLGMFLTATGVFVSSTRKR
jgi:cytochrome c-type biogenesis protein CcmF